MTILCRRCHPAGQFTLEIYIEPNNIFVAGFIGSPAMNFLDAVLRRRRNLYVAARTFKLPIPAEKPIKNIDKYVDKEIVFGIRPEDIKDVALVGTMRQQPLK